MVLHFICSYLTSDEYIGVRFPSMKNLRIVSLSRKGVQNTGFIHPHYDYLPWLMENRKDSIYRYQTRELNVTLLM